MPRSPSAGRRRALGGTGLLRAAPRPSRWHSQRTLPPRGGTRPSAAAAAAAAALRAPGCRAGERGRASPVAAALNLPRGSLFIGLFFKQAFGVLTTAGERPGTLRRGEPRGVGARGPMSPPPPSAPREGPRCPERRDGRSAAPGRRPSEPSCACDRACDRARSASAAQCSGWMTGTGVC